MKRLALTCMLLAGCGNYWSHSSSTAGAIAGAAVAAGALAATAAAGIALHKETDTNPSRGLDSFDDVIPSEAELLHCPDGHKTFSRVCDSANGCRYEINGGKVFRCPDRACKAGPPAELLAWCGPGR